MCKSVVLELDWVLRGYYKSPPADVLAVLAVLHHASYRLCTSIATSDDKRFARKAAAQQWRPTVNVLGA